MEFIAETVRVAAEVEAVVVEVIAEAMVADIDEGLLLLAAPMLGRKTTDRFARPGLKSLATAERKTNI